MVRSEYIRCLQRLYLAANNSDNEEKATWMRGDECRIHCNAFETILEDMGIRSELPPWYEERPEPIPLSEEEKKRFGPMLQRTWGAIASDAIECNPDLEGSADKPSDLEGIIEITIDANHPEFHGGMSHPEYMRLLECTRIEATQVWLRKVLNY